MNTPILESLTAMAAHHWTSMNWPAQAIAIFLVAIVCFTLLMMVIESFQGPILERHIVGTRDVSAKQLAKRTRAEKPDDRSKQILFGSVPWPLDLEHEHALIVGTTGVGKSTLIRQLLPQIRKKGGRAIVIDLNGEFAHDFMQSGDKIFNPLISKSVNWNPLSEIHSKEDLDLILKASVPTGRSADDESWRNYARQFMRALMIRLKETGQLNLERLRYFGLEAGEKELAAFLQDGEQPYRMQANNMMSTIKTLAQGCIQSLGMAPNKSDFSIRKWVQSGSGFIFITPRDKDLAAIGPLINTFMNLAIAEALSAPVQKRYQPITLVIDELASFELDDYQAVLAKGRKFGLVAISGIQNIAQLRQKFGPDGATTLLSCFRTKVIFNPGDAETGQRMSDEIGKKTVERRETSTSRSNSGISQNVSWRRGLPEAAVTSETLNSLPKLNAYIKLGGDYPVARIVIPLPRS